jgi:hypothetical protein
MKVRGYESITKVPSKIILYCTRRYFRTFVRIEGTFVRKYESTESTFEGTFVLFSTKVLSYFQKYSTISLHVRVLYNYCTDKVAFGDT